MLMGHLQMERLHVINLESGLLLSTGNINNIGLPAGTQEFRT